MHRQMSDAKKAWIDHSVCLALGEALQTCRGMTSSVYGDSDVRLPAPEGRLNEKR